MTAPRTFAPTAIRQAAPSLCIYVIGATGVEAVKIGRAIEPRRRVMDFQIGCPLKLTLLWAAPTRYAARLERRLHRRFRESRLHGEWFALGLDPVPQVMRAFREEEAQIPADEPEDQSIPVPVASINHRGMQEKVIRDVASLFREGDALLLPVADIIQRLRQRDPDHYGSLSERRVQLLLAKSLGETTVALVPETGRRARCLLRNQAILGEDRIAG